MGRIIKLLVLLVILGFVGLVGYAYLGPFFGADFNPPSEEIREVIELDVS